MANRRGWHPLSTNVTRVQGVNSGNHRVAQRVCVYSAGPTPAQAPERGRCRHTSSRLARASMTLRVRQYMIIIQCTRGWSLTRGGNQCGRRRAREVEYELLCFGWFLLWMRIGHGMQLTKDGLTERLYLRRNILSKFLYKLQQWWFEVLKSPNDTICN